MNDGNLNRAIELAYDAHRRMKEQMDASLKLANARILVEDEIAKIARAAGMSVTDDGSLGLTLRW